VPGKTELLHDHTLSGEGLFKATWHHTSLLAHHRWLEKSLGLDPKTL